MPDLFVSQNTQKKPSETSQKEEAAPTELTLPVQKSIEGNHIHAFSSFCQDPPKNMHFQNQDDDEKILLFLRAHFITNVPWILGAIILAVLPPLFLIYQSFVSLLFSISIPQNFVTVFVLFYYLLVFTYIFVNFIHWFYNIALVTNKRVVDIDFSDLVFHDVAITKLNLIEDVSYVQSGFLRSFFNYGDVFVQTAGETKHFDFLAVPNPQRTVTIISDLIGRKAHV